MCVFRNRTKNKRRLNRIEIDGGIKMSEEVGVLRKPYKHIKNAKRKDNAQLLVQKFIFIQYVYSLLSYALFL